MTAPVDGWQKAGRCREIGPGAFVPATDHEPLDLYRQARPVCAGCPVKAQCLEYALDLEGPVPTAGRSGIYGGLSPRQRYSVYRKRQKVARAAA